VQHVEGVLPRICKNLLNARKKAKKEMGKTMRIYTCVCGGGGGGGGGSGGSVGRCVDGSMGGYALLELKRTCVFCARVCACARE